MGIFYVLLFFTNFYEFYIIVKIKRANFYRCKKTLHVNFLHRNYDLQLSP